MEQYIPKSALVAEIERRYKLVDKYETNEFCAVASRDELVHLMNFINTLEVIEVDLRKEIDLDAAIDAYMDKNFGEPWDGARPVGSFELATMAEYFFKLGLKAQKGE